jgi:hypothetical protein
MNIRHYGNAFDVFKWSWLIDFAHRRGCGDLTYLPLQTDAAPAKPPGWTEPTLTSEHPAVAPEVAAFFRAEHRVFERGDGVPALTRLGSLLGQSGITPRIDTRTYRRSASADYVSALKLACGRTLMVIDPDNGLCDPEGAYNGFCRHGNDMHVCVDDVREAIERVMPHAVALTQYNTRKPGCFEDVQQFFRTIGPQDGKCEFRIFRGRAVVALKELREW